MKKEVILLSMTLLGVNVCFAQTEFTHITDSRNVSYNYTLLDYPGLDNVPDMVVVFIPQNDGTPNNKPVGVWYTGSKWSIFNQDRQEMPLGVKFKVIFQRPDGNAFVVTASAANLVNGRVKVDNPNLNGNPQARFIFSQYWNSGVYNNSFVEATYTDGFWYLSNANGQPIPVGAGFAFLLSAKESPQSSQTPPTPPSTINLPARDILNVGAVRNDVEFDNWSFERGIVGWSVGHGDAFNHQPVEGETIPTDRALRRMDLSNGGIGGDYWKGMTYPIGIKGKNWVGTFEGQGDAPIGSLYSPSFKLTKSFVSCLVGGTKKPRQIRVELQMKKTEYDAVAGNKVMKMTGENLAYLTEAGLNASSVDGEYQIIKVAFPLSAMEDLQRFQWELPQEAIGKTFRIRIFDNAADGHINVDDFQFTDRPVPVIQGMGGTTAFDVDKPLWGFADTHTHPTNNLGFGGKTIVGAAAGNMATEFSREKCISMHSDLGAGVTNNMMVAQADPHHMEGYPDFVGFPRFNSKFHQQQHVEWIKRAYEGGLRLICALGVTNMYWATRAMGLGTRPDAPIDDESACLQQIEEMKRIVAQNASWMEIAYTPRQAREIILSGKLAVVLGVEMDNFGNFKDNDYTWQDNYPMPPSKPLVALPDDMPTATRMMQDKMNYYYNLGIRQVTPMHYINGVFGGTAQFRYEFSLINHAFHNKPYELTDGYNHGIAYNILVDGASFSNIMKGLLGNAVEAYAKLFSGQSNQGRCVGCTFSTVNSTMCATGLTNKGELMFRELMRKGFIIDMEHSSQASVDRIFSIAQPYDYPIISSHTDPRELSFKASYAARFEGSNEDKVRLFGTSVIGNLTHEGMLSPQNYDKIARSGGTVGVLAFPYRKKTYSHPENRVTNDCDGSSKTWCQMYLYSLHKMNGRGVALSTDRGFNDFIAPRFGAWAAYSLKHEYTHDLKFTLREQQRFAQADAVRYSSPIAFFHPLLFQEGDINDVEEDAWKAVAYYHVVSTNAQNAPESAYIAHRGRIKNFIDGMNMTYEQAAAFVLAGGATTHERLAGYCVKNGITPQQLPDARWHNDEWVRKNYYYLSNVWNLWKRMVNSTKNEPLRRCKTGTREWDYNLEGLAHYGLIPDFLQDCKNVGLTAQQLKPLFNSAEDYIKMWEKAESAKLNVR
jgi:microsomal dipeptidase-like Zn-dependent dipeptidase